MSKAMDVQEIKCERKQSLQKLRKLQRSALRLKHNSTQHFIAETSQALQQNRQKVLTDNHRQAQQIKVDLITTRVENIKQNFRAAKSLAAVEHSVMKKIKQQEPLLQMTRD